MSGLPQGLFEQNQICKGAVRRAAIESCERCILHSPLTVTTRACSCHHEIETFLSRGDSYLAARVKAP